jgi:hypothetical protein
VSRSGSFTRRLFGVTKLLSSRLDWRYFSYNSHNQHVLTSSREYNWLIFPGEHDLFLPFKNNGQLLSMMLLRLLVALTFFFPFAIGAQSMSEFEAWKQQYMGEFQEYKDQVDKEFSEFLNQKWEAFDTEKGLVRDDAPKPVKIPVAKVKPQPVPDTTQPQNIPAKPVVPRQPVQIVKPQPVVIAVPSEPDINQRSVEVEYLGLKLNIVDGMYQAYTGFNQQVSQNSIQHNFSALAKSDYPDTVKNLISYKQQLDMNDWAYLQLVLKFSEKLPLSRNNQRLVSWFLLLKSDLKARLAYDSNNIYLLVAARQNLYDITYFRYDGEKFYAIPQTRKLPAEVFSYNGKYPRALTSPDFSMVKNLKLNPDTKQRKLSFKFQGKQYQFTIPVNKNRITFFASYPQMDITEYFHTQLDDQTANALLTQLEPVLTGMSETEAVNFLLAFVQHAFRYQTDNQQFGEENYLFIEETLYYPSSDCEDRSFIFSWLVRNLLGLEVIGLEYPGHVATAVALKQPEGDVINYHNKKFTVADPTYINARVGMTMPQYRKTVASVIAP